MKNNELVRRIAPGTGRDFVVGDIHGCFGMLKEALARVYFNPERDRLFCVGDLIDRGPHSSDVLEFLYQPWVFSVRGNHEQSLLDLYRTGELNQVEFQYHVVRNGLHWWQYIPEGQRQPYLYALESLPYVIELETPKGLVGIVHAEVPLGMTWNKFIQDIEAGIPRTVMSCIYGRVRISHNIANEVAGVSRIYVGHTPVPHQQTLANHVYIDTGAVYPQIQGHITLALLVDWSEQP